jgi:hypothetical protein
MVIADGRDQSGTAVMAAPFLETSLSRTVPERGAAAYDSVTRGVLHHELDDQSGDSPPSVFGFNKLIQKYALSGEIVRQYRTKTVDMSLLSGSVIF